MFSNIFPWNIVEYCATGGFPAGVARFLVFGIWFLVFGFWFLVFGIWYLGFRIWYLVFCIWYLVLGSSKAW